MILNSHLQSILLTSYHVSVVILPVCAIQAIEDMIVQIFYNVHTSDPERSDSLVKVCMFHMQPVVVCLQSVVVT